MVSLLSALHNIKSLHKNGWKLAPYIDGLNEKRDIILLSETWFNKTNIGNLPGCKVFISSIQLLEMIHFLNLSSCKIQSMK